MSGGEALQRMQAALDRLPVRDRRVFLSVRFDGLGYAEVARIHGLSVRRVERIMTRVIADLDRAAHG